MRFGSSCGACAWAVAAEAPPAEAAPQEARRRLFFALWPDEAMREAMALATRKAVQASAGRPIPAGNLHITLAFLGSIPEQQLPQLGEIARRAATLCAEAVPPPADGPHIEVIFEHLEYWRAAHLLCAVPPAPPARMAALARRLQVLLTESGFPPDLKPFRPHVTVVRKVLRPGPPSEMHPVVWRFTDLALIESRTLPEGALYSVVESYSLCSGIKAENNSKTS
jgi:2'-5' RNA ligase